MNPCQFCEEFKTRNIIFNNKVIARNRILFESENFNVFPSLGQIVEGYLLISSKKHYLSIAQIPDKLYPELKQVQKKVKKVLTNNYQKPLFFEHGPLNEQEKGGCCIEHAHLHCVPANADILEEILKNFPSKIIDSFSEIPKNTQYLFLEQNNIKYLFILDTIIPAQYIRQILAVKLDKEDKWDWRQSPEVSKLKNTIKKLNDKF